MHFSRSKTKAIYFSTKKITDIPILKFKNYELDLVSSHVHLGVTFSNSLTLTPEKKHGLMKILNSGL